MMVNCRLICVAVVSGAVFSAHAGGSAWNAASDALAVGLPLLAAKQAMQEDDMSGARQLAASLGTAVLSTEWLKSQIHETRPDHSDNRSFPSGHTAVAFASARYLEKRYGEQINPYWVYGAAALTAVARVQADKHHWHDTLAGAALGYGAAHYWTERQAGGQMSVLPSPAGVSVAWQRAW